MSPFLPYGKQVIDEEDIEAVVAVLRSDWLTTGPQVESFENDFANECNAAHAISCSSATAGLQMAAKVLDLGPGKSVIVPSLTFLASASAPYMNGAEVVFADVDADTGLLTPESFMETLQRHNDKNICAVIPMHLAGRVCEMEKIQEIAKARGIAVIEDACHALGASYADRDGNNHKVGACEHSDLAVFSFHPVKTIASGEGGAVCTKSIDLAQKLYLARSHGIVRDPGSWIGSRFGYGEDGQVNPWFYECHAPMPNFRMSDINAALANSQLKKLSKFIKRRSSIADMYDPLISAIGDNILPPKRQNDVNLGWHLYSVRVNFEEFNVTRKTVVDRLHENNIGSQVHYIPLPLQPFWMNMGWDYRDFPGAMHYYERTLSIPLFPSMQERDVYRVVKALAQALGSEDLRG